MQTRKEKLDAEKKEAARAMAQDQAQRTDQEAAQEATKCTISGCPVCDPRLYTVSVKAGDTYESTAVDVKHEKVEERVKRTVEAIHVSAPVGSYTITVTQQD